MSSIAVEGGWELPLQLASGDERSYEELVRRYGGKMLSVACRILGNPEDGRDCVQDAFLQAFKNIGKFEGRSSLGTWLLRIVVNSALLMLRSRRRRPEGSLDELMPEFDENRCRIEPRRATEDSVETLASKQETRDARKASRGLPQCGAAQRHRGSRHARHRDDSETRSPAL